MSTGVITGFNWLLRMRPCVRPPSSIHIFQLATEGNVVRGLRKVSTFPVVLVVMMVLDVHHAGRHPPVGVEVGPELDVVHTQPVSHCHFHRGRLVLVVAVVTRLVVTGKINFNLLNCGNSLRESDVVPVSGVPLGLNVASLHWNLLFSGSEVGEVPAVSVYLPARLCHVVPPLPQSH